MTSTPGPRLHVALLFPEDALSSVEDVRNANGARSANVGFARALLRHARAHDMTVSLVADVPHVLIRGTPDRWDLLRGQFDHDVEILSLTDLPALFGEQPVDVLHRLTQHMYRSLYIRNGIARQPFAVTGVTHGLSYANFHEWVLLTLLARPQPNDRLVCTTEMAEDVVRSMVASVGGSLGRACSLPTTVIPLGVDVGRFGAGGREARERLGIPGDEVMLLSVARFSHLTKADLRPLLAAFARVAERASARAHLVLAGATGAEADPRMLGRMAAEHGIADRVHFAENPAEDDKVALYRAADIFVALGDNVQETFGLALVEASAAGLPVVASDWSGFRTLVADGHTGYLIPTTALGTFPSLDALAPLYHNVVNLHLASQAVGTDLDVLCDRLIRLVDQPRLRRTLGDAARAYAQRFSWDRVVEQYDALWTGLRSQRDLCLINPDDPPRLNFRSAFAAYPTRLLRRDDLVTTSESGARLLTSTEPLQPYSALAEVISAEVATQILRRAARGELAGELMSELADGGDPWLVAFHLLWLHKYGLLSITPGAST
ncbi:glycosyltransferase family 4 protein [Actinoplanes sp. NEAU-A12]|uniref:Glycosyltransferase family 4 protein n=1 Tax=Actinoplanes sandaracinus TaxID=3045177 RepID=A0ABT6WUG7_9ACTN|nr:glycosyltransferase family 4 protein [Actinoplanes sandaracinus]MDI6103339.1 glycosyltransferase family 4 protein [Actinoplanes sandaracinus]